MSLYKAINNEALDEDLAVQRSVLERLKASVKDNTEKVKPTATLDKPTKSVFDKLNQLLQKNIYKVFGYIASRNVYKYQGQPYELNLGEITSIFADVGQAYNAIVSFLMRISFNKLDDGSKTYINNQLSSLVPLLQRMETELNTIVPDSLLLIISNIKNSIILKAYSYVSFFGAENTKEFRQLKDILKRREQIGVPFTKKDLEGEQETEDEKRARKTRLRRRYENIPDDEDEDDEEEEDDLDEFLDAL